MEYYSVIEKNETLSFATKMYGTGGHYVGWNKPDTKTSAAGSLSYMGLKNEKPTWLQDCGY
jgi:hypothetical protein